MRTPEEVIKLLRSYEDIFCGKYLMLEAADIIEKLLAENQILKSKE